MSRRNDLDRLYTLFADLRDRLGGYQRLDDCHGRLDWPDRGVYFFFSPTETRTDDDQRRLTRVGTHAVSTGSGTTLWSRLRTHRGALSGTYADGGNHRGSVFRKRVGEAFLERDELSDYYPTWGDGSTADRETRLTELPLERRVSDYIRSLPFLWVQLDDEPGPESERAAVERTTIALVSNYAKPAIDERNPRWLGRFSRSEKLRRSGLWNVDHVDDAYDPAVLDRLATAVETTDPV